MPTKSGHRAGAIKRNTSSGSSRANLNLHFTQKDAPAPSKLAPHRATRKENGHVTHEAIPRNGSGHVRSNSAVRIQSKEHIALAPSKRTLTAYADRPRAAASRHKADFTIASPSNDDDSDEDEWISSEAPSGAATPRKADSDSDSDDIPPPPPAQPARLQSAATVVAPPADALRLSLPLPAPAVTPLTQPTTPHTPDSAASSSPPTPSAAPLDTRSATTSPTHRRRAPTRPPSQHSVTRLEPPLRPHPLIRAHSHGRDSIVSAAPAPALSDSPPPSTHAPDLYAARRASVSSARSVATVPVQATWSARGHDRTRTLSTMSTSSANSLAAIQHMAGSAGAKRRSVMLPHLTCHLPPVDPPGKIEAMHQLLPQPYLSQHITVVSYRDPMQESYERVSRARAAR